MGFVWKFIVPVIVGWLVLPLAAFSGEENIIRARDFDDFLDRSPYFRPLSSNDLPEFPIIIEASSGYEDHVDHRTQWDKILAAFGSAKWCFSLQVDSVSFHLVGFNEGDDRYPYAGIAELHCQILEDHLFRETGSVSIFAYGVDVPDKFLGRPGRWNPEEVVGRSILATGHYNHGSLSLFKEMIFFIGPGGEWENQNGRPIGREIIDDILRRRRNFLHLDSQFRQSHTVILGRLISDTPLMMASHDGPVSFAVDRVFKGEAEDVAKIDQYWDPWSNLSTAKFYLDIPYLLFLKKEVEGPLILEDGRNSAFAVLNGQVFGSSGFPFAQVDTLGFWVE